MDILWTFYGHPIDIPLAFYRHSMDILYTFYTDYPQILNTIKNKIKSKSIFIKVFKTLFLILSVSNYTKYTIINTKMIRHSMIT